MTEQLLFNTLVEFFEEDEWDFQWVEGTSFLMLDFSGKQGSWRCYAQARETQQQFVFYSVLPVNAPENKRAPMAEFITRVNYGMIIGNFEMDFEDGEIRYKTSIDVEGAELLHPLIRQVVYANLIITDRYLPGVMKVLYADVTPQEALETIEDTDEDAEDDEDELNFAEDDFSDDLDDLDLDLDLGEDDLGEDDLDDDEPPSYRLN